MALSQDPLAQAIMRRAFNQLSWPTFFKALLWGRLPARKLVGGVQLEKIDKNQYKNVSKVNFFFFPRSLFASFCSLLKSLSFFSTKLASCFTHGGGGRQWEPNFHKCHQPPSLPTRLPRYRHLGPSTLTLFPLQWVTGQCYSSQPLSYLRKDTAAVVVFSLPCVIQFSVSTGSVHHHENNCSLSLTPPLANSRVLCLPLHSTLEITVYICCPYFLSSDSTHFCQALTSYIYQWLSLQWPDHGWSKGKF